MYQMDIDNLHYEITKHARQVILERKIEPNWIVLALSNPKKIEQDSADPELEHALAQIPEFGNRVLRVIYNKNETPLKIITAYFDRTMKGKL